MDSKVEQYVLNTSRNVNKFKKSMSDSAKLLNLNARNHALLLANL
jgi:hypothetical protein